MEPRELLPIGPRDYQDALDVQNACNLSGVAHSLFEVCRRLRASGVTDTSAVNTHPIVRMYASKIGDLTGSWSGEWPFDAERICREQAAHAS